MPKSTDLIVMYRYPNPIDQEKELDLLDEQTKIVEIKCKSKKIITKLDDGSILCADKVGQLNPLLNTGKFHFGVGWEYIISNRIYKTPIGQELVMSEDSYGVNVNYLLTPDALLSYSWSLPPNAANIDPTYLISVDKLIRTAILAHQVNNYPWPK